MTDLSPTNFADVISAFLAEQELSIRRFALLIGCSEATANRLLTRETAPTKEMLNHSAILLELGVNRFTKLSKAERERILEAIGITGGAVVGLSSVTAIVSSLGTVSGLSAPGISSGLYALGQAIGAGMAGGVAVVAAVPLAACVFGFGLAKGLKRLAIEVRLNNLEVEPRWETPMAPEPSEPPESDSLNTEADT